MKIALPRKVMMIIKNLQLHGYEAYAVGGCVRDSILARRPKDWDITTSARPEEVKKLFRRPNRCHHHIPKCQRHL